MIKAEPDRAVDDAAADGEQAATEPLQREQADKIVASTSASTILKILKQTEFDQASVRVFKGFRVGADAFKKFPVTKQRLAVELINDVKLAKEFLESQSHPDPAPIPVPKPAKVEKPLNGAQKPAETVRFDDKLIAERDKLRRELAEANRAAAMQSELSSANAKRFVQLEAALSELQTSAAAASSREKAHLRRIKRLESELDHARTLIKALPDSPKPLESSPSSHGVKRSPERTIDTPAQSVVGEAIDRLLSRQKTDVAAAIAEEMLHVDPANVEARHVHAMVNVARGDRSAALEDLRTVFEAQLVVDDCVAATRTLVRSIAVTREPDRKMATALFAALAKQPVGVVKSAGAALEPLEDSAAYDSLQRLCHAKLCAQLFTSSGESGSDRLLIPQPLRAVLGDNITASKLVQAIDRNESGVVHAAREALSGLDKKTREAVGELILNAGDSSYVALLNRRSLQGAAVIDASNVANYELDILGKGVARLANIVAVRSELRQLGFFPVHMIGDANLPRDIDDKVRTYALVRADELRLVPGGTDADEEIIRDARRFNAIVVTNDKYRDWEKSVDVDLVEYSISMTDGRATLYF